MNVNGHFIGYGLNDVSVECQHVNHRLLYAYPGKSNAVRYGVTDTTTFTTATVAALYDLVEFMNGDKASQLAAGTRGAVFPLRTDGVADLNVRKAIGAYQVPGQVCVGFSIGGAGSNMDGYPADVVNACDKSRCYHQPIGYSTAPVPMNKGVLTGVAEFINQLSRPRPEFGGRNCETIPWFGVFYSMGSIVGMTVLMRILYGDLQRFKPTYMGSSSFGNPMRQAGHVFPDGIPVDGEGIAKDAVYQMPDCHWDFVSSKGMVGGTGDDWYAKVGGAGQLYEQDELTLKDIRSVWRIVNTGNPLTLAEQVASLVLSPTFSKFKDAFGAAWGAAQFFIGKSLSPHTTYQFVQPRAGDPRSAWDHALWHSSDMVANLPQPFAVKVGAA